MLISFSVNLSANLLIYDDNWLQIVAALRLIRLYTVDKVNNSQALPSIGCLLLVVLQWCCGVERRQWMPLAGSYYVVVVTL
jgi:hypothetical protein